jgi:putative oxidoreductase
MDTAVLVVRLIVGLAIVAHGAQKLFGWFGGHGLKGTGGFFDGLGFRPGTLFALAAGLGEVGGGLLTALGLLWPAGPVLIVFVMVVAIAGVHLSNGFFAASNRIELPLMYLTVALGLAFTDPGAYSLDVAFDRAPLVRGEQVWLAVAVAVALGLLNVVLRRPMPVSAGSRG